MEASSASAASLVRNCVTGTLPFLAVHLSNQQNPRFFSPPLRDSAPELPQGFESMRKDHRLLPLLANAAEQVENPFRLAALSTLRVDVAQRLQPRQERQLVSLLTPAAILLDSAPIGPVLCFGQIEHLDRVEYGRQLFQDFLLATPQDVRTRPAAQR